MRTLTAFTADEAAQIKRHLATRVGEMMGRKFEEGDWSFVYCRAKGIPQQGWSNLHIDVMHKGLGVEHKMLCVGEGKSLLTYAGTSLMHPSATRSIRIASTRVKPEVAMREVFDQYRRLIEQRTAKVAESTSRRSVDMRTGWLIWERSLTEFLYFEVPMLSPDPAKFWAEWHETAARGARKPSKNLWIYEKGSNKKRYSVTTNAGIKIQPYFDIPSPKDPNLYFFRVQGEEISRTRILIWISAAAARDLKTILGRLDSYSLSNAIVQAAKHADGAKTEGKHQEELAMPIQITKEAYLTLTNKWSGVSDEHRIRLFIQTLRAA